MIVYVIYEIKIGRYDDLSNFHLIVKSIKFKQP